MTADGGKYSEGYWDEARIALGRVAQRFDEGPDFTVEELRGLPNYELIPEPVRQAIEDLSVEERQFVKRIFTTLAQNHFYLENNLGRGLAALGY
jgi:hypothetical protein